MNTPIIITNSKDVVIGKRGPDTLENLTAQVALIKVRYDLDGNPHRAFITVMDDGGVWVTIPAFYCEGMQFCPVLFERVAYLVGSDAQAEADK